MMSRTDKEFENDFPVNQDSSNEDTNFDYSSQVDNESDSLEEYTSSEDCEEEDYFGDDKLFLESSNEEEAWADSESDEDILREKYKKEPGWINNKKFKKTTNILTSFLKMSYIPCVFKSNFNLKLILSADPFIYLVDTMNIIYVLKDEKLISTFKIDRWSISSICLYRNKLLISSNKSNKLKYILDSQLIDIKKIYTRNINKIININSSIYILGDTTQCLNEDLEIQDESFNKLINLVSYKDFLLGLSDNGDILQFTSCLKLVNKIIYEDKFSFRNIKVVDSLLVIQSVNLILINEEFQYIREMSGDDFTDYKGLYLCFTKNGIKILNQEFNIVKMFKKTCTQFCRKDDKLFMCNYRELNSLEINSK